MQNTALAGQVVPWFYEGGMLPADAPVQFNVNHNRIHG